MADIFISYARADRERARTVASALQARGWSVWWDRDVKAGQAFDQAIENELETATSVVVLWSKDSVASDWVKSEAAAAVQRGVFVPARLDNVKLPIEFSRRQTADLVGWDGDTSHAGFQALCDGMAGIAGMTPRSNRTLQRISRATRGIRSAY
jgi:TIR domain